MQVRDLPIYPTLPSLLVLFFGSPSPLQNLTMKQILVPNSVERISCKGMMAKNILAMICKTLLPNLHADISI